MDMKTILNSSDKWPATALELIKGLEEMRLAYAGFAANFSSKLYLYQDLLGLDDKDIIAIQTDLAQMRHQINTSSESMVKNIIINVPAPHLGALPREDT